MTTDTKAVARWDVEAKGEGLDSLYVKEFENYCGPYVLFTDHERVMGDEVEHRRRWFVRAGEYLSRAQAAERSASRSAEECLFLRSQRPLARKLTEAEAEIENLRTALAASRAEVEGLKRLLPEVRMCVEYAIDYGSPSRRSERKELINTIDAAMEKGNV